MNFLKVIKKRLINTMHDHRPKTCENFRTEH